MVPALLAFMLSIESDVAFGTVEESAYGYGSDAGRQLDEGIGIGTSEVDAFDNIQGRFNTFRSFWDNIGYKSAW